jgi:N-glycosylase/DNA lyase
MFKTSRRLYARSKVFILIVALIQLVLSYGFISLAIDRGNLWWYILSIFFLVRTIKDIYRAIRINNGRQTANA